MLSFDAWLGFDGLGFIGLGFARLFFAEELKDYDFVVFVLQPYSRTVESELRASVPVSPQVSSVDPKISLSVILHIDVRFTNFLEIEVGLEDGRVLILI